MRLLPALRRAGRVEVCDQKDDHNRRINDDFEGGKLGHGMKTIISRESSLIIGL